MQRIFEHERCAACGRIAPDDPAVVATVAGLKVAYLCGDCPPWDVGETFRAFEAQVRECYAGLPVRFAFWPGWAVPPADRRADHDATTVAGPVGRDAR